MPRYDQAQYVALLCFLPDWDAHMWAARRRESTPTETSISPAASWLARTFPLYICSIIFASSLEQYTVHLALMQSSGFFHTVLRSLWHWTRLHIHWHRCNMFHAILFAISPWGTGVTSRRNPKDVGRCKLPPSWEEGARNGNYQTSIHESRHSHHPASTS